MASITARIAVGHRGATARQATMLEVKTVWAESGLAVTRDHSDQGWAITHLRSGYALIAGIRHLRDARTVAIRMLDAGDWTRNRTAVLADRKLRDRALQIRDEARMLGLVNV